MKYIQSRGKLQYKELCDDFDGVGRSRGLVSPYYYTAAHPKGLWLSDYKIVNEGAEEIRYIGLIPWQNIKKVRLDQNSRRVFIVVKDIKKVINNQVDCTLSQLKEDLATKHENIAKRREDEKALTLHQLQTNGGYGIYHKMHDSEDYAVALKEDLFSRELFDAIEKHVELEEKEEPFNEYELEVQQKDRKWNIISMILVVIIFIACFIFYRT